MAIDNEAKRWGMLQFSSGAAVTHLVNPNGSDLDDETERLSLANIYGGILAGAESSSSAALTGSAVAADWEVIRDSGGTIIVTLTGDTYIAAGTGPIGTLAQSDTFVQSFVALATPTNGWNNTISLNNTHLARTADDIATITVPATGAYDPQETETISGAVQAAILVTGAVDLDPGDFKIKFGLGDGFIDVITNSITSNITSNLAS